MKGRNRQPSSDRVESLEKNKKFNLARIYLSTKYENCNIINPEIEITIWEWRETASKHILNINQLISFIIHHSH